MKRSLLFALLALLSTQLCAADAGKRYFKLKDDTDLYVGEGLASSGDFGGDGLKALKSAQEQARAALASSIRVRITTETHDTMQSGAKGSSQELSSESKSLADVILENVRDEDFVDFPENGKVTVLAYVSKEDYRRQLAGKSVKVYRPEFGFRIMGAFSLPDIGDLNGDQSSHPGGDPAGAELDFIWRSFYFGYQIQFDQHGVSDQIPKSYTISALNLGYDWAPWAWRVQPYVPVQLQYAYWDMDPSFAQTFEASAGLGLRFWANDTIAFQIQGCWNQGFWGGAVYQSGGNFVTVNGHGANVAMTGPEFGAGITWSGF